MALVDLHAPLLYVMKKNITLGKKGATNNPEVELKRTDVKIRLVEKRAKGDSVYIQIC